MNGSSRPSTNGHAETSEADISVATPGAPREKSPHGMSTRTRLLFYLIAWLIVLLPFLFWWNTWFGRRLPDKQITEYLRDDKRPRHIQHALVQVGERIMHHDTTVARWYAELVRLSTHPVEEVRNTDAWVMGQDTKGAGFHEALLRMLQDSSPMVRGNAALSLVRFQDDSGREQIVALLQPSHVFAPSAGRITDTARVGTAIHGDGIIAKVATRPSPNSPGGESITEIRSPISGRIHSISMPTGATVTAGAEIATIDPGDEQVWEALRGLYLIGRAEDLTAIRPYERESRDIPDRVREQAFLADQAIRSRASAQP
jgi:biotin carboxyl carrier protein